MRFTLHQKNLDITPALREYVEQKILKPVEKFIKNIRVPELPILDIEIGRTTQHHKKGQVFRAEANLKLNGAMIRAEAVDEDAHAACDSVKEQLRREIISYKTRALSLFKRRARSLKKAITLDPAAQFRRKGRTREEGI
mgnify:CR=1 FL=1